MSTTIDERLPIPTPRFARGRRTVRRMTEDAARRKVVVLYLSRPDESLRTHEGTTLVAVADAIARLKHYRFAGRWDESHRQSDRHLLRAGRDAPGSGSATARH